MRTLEIGAGNAVHPLWSPTITRRELAPEDSYVGVDIGVAGSSPDGMPQVPIAAEWQTRNEDGELVPVTDADMYAQWNSIRHARPGEKITFVQADAARLPFADESFDRVVANNVLGYGSDPEKLGRIFCEADRVLAADGQLIIHDNISPRFQRESALYADLLVQRIWLIAKARLLRGGNREFHDACRQYGFPTMSLEQLKEPLYVELVQDWTLFILGKTASKSMIRILPPLPA